MSGMFWNARYFDQDITQWNTKNVVDMYNMIKGASSLSFKNRSYIYSLIRSLAKNVISVERR